MHDRDDRMIDIIRDDEKETQRAPHVDPLTSRLNIQPPPSPNKTTRPDRKKQLNPFHNKALHLPSDRDGQPRDQSNIAPESGSQTARTNETADQSVGRPSQAARDVPDQSPEPQGAGRDRPTHRQVGPPNGMNLQSGRADRHSGPAAPFPGQAAEVASVTSRSDPEVDHQTQATHSARQAAPSKAHTPSGQTNQQHIGQPLQATHGNKPANPTVDRQAQQPKTRKRRQHAATVRANEQAQAEHGQGLLDVKESTGPQENEEETKHNPHSSLGTKVWDANDTRPTYVTLAADRAARLRRREERVLQERIDAGDVTGFTTDVAWLHLAQHTSALGTTKGRGHVTPARVRERAGEVSLVAPYHGESLGPRSTLDPRALTLVDR